MCDIRNMFHGIRYQNEQHSPKNESDGFSVFSVFMHENFLCMKEIVARCLISYVGVLCIDGYMTQPWFHVITRSPAIAEGPRDAGVPVEIW